MDILKLKKSKTREIILRFFFSDVNRKHYLRELEKILNISVGNIRRELLSLEKGGLFIKERVGNQVYYFLNTDSSIFMEVKEIVSKTIGLEAILKDCLLKIKNIKICFIYGSIAKKTENSLSDIDIFVSGDIDEDKLANVLRVAEKKLSREVNYTLFSEKELKKRISDDVFLKDIIFNEKIFLIGNKNELETIIK